MRTLALLLNLIRIKIKLLPCCGDWFSKFIALLWERPSEVLAPLKYNNIIFFRGLPCWPPLYRMRRYGRIAIGPTSRRCQSTRAWRCGGVLRGLSLRTILTPEVPYILIYQTQFPNSQIAFKTPRSAIFLFDKICSSHESIYLVLSNYC